MKLTELAEKAINTKGADADGAAEWMVGVIYKEAEDKKVLREVCYDAARAAVELARARGRQACRSTAARLSAVSMEAVAAVEAAVPGVLARWFVQDKGLLECTRVDLQDAMASERAAAEGHLANVRFYEALAARLKNDKVTVQTALTVREVMLLLDNTQKVSKRKAG